MQDRNRVSIEDRVLGGLIGGAIGDALGAPMECMHYRRIREVFGDVRRFADFTADNLQHSMFNSKDIAYLGKVTDDTVLADLLIDCILEHNGEITAIEFAQHWEKFEDPVPNPDGDPIIRIKHMHWIERIPFFRNRLFEIPKRDLGRGEANATNAIMYIAPVGLLCAGDPAQAELMAVDVTSVNQHGRSRDPAGGYAAAVAACFIPGITIEEIVRLAIHHTHEPICVRELEAIVALTRTCTTCSQFIERYYTDILGKIIPYQDVQHQGTPYCVTWISTEILGPVLATLLITQGNDVEEMVLACARIGRDADTVCRAAGGLIGALRGLGSLPEEWRQVVLAKNRWLRLEEKSVQLTALIEQRLTHRRDRFAHILNDV